MNIYDMTDTWGDVSTTFSAIKMNVTDTASASGSLLMDLQVGGSSKFSINKDGVIKPLKIHNTTIQSSDPDIINITGDSNWGGNLTPIFSVDMNYAILKNWNKWGQGEIQYGAVSGSSSFSSIRFMYGSGSIIKSQGVDSCVSSGSRFGILNNGYLGFNESTQYTGPFNVRLYRDADNILAQRNGTNAQTFRIYNTYTDASNYIRQSQSFTSYGGTIYAQLAAEGAGTGDVNVPFVVSPKGTGAFILGPMPDGTATGGNARGQYAVDLQMYRSAATQVVGGDYGVGIGTQITISGNSGTVGIGRNISIQDSLGGSVCLGRNITASAYRSVAIGNGVTVGGDAIGIGTGTYATHGSAICFMGSRSRFNGHILWEGSFYPVPAGTSYNNHTHIGGLEIGTAAVRTVDTTPTILSNTISSSSITTRQRHKGAVLQNDFTITAIRSDGAINKYCRRVWVKDLSNVAGTASTLSILSIDVVGTDVTEISGASITVGVNNTTRSIEISVTGEAGFSATGVATTDIITAVGHTFTNDDVVVFTSLTGGDGLTSNAAGWYYAGIYKVINVNGDDFQLATVGSSTTPIDFTTDITSGTITRPINWYKTAGRFAVSAGGY